MSTSNEFFSALREKQSRPKNKKRFAIEICSQREKKDRKQQRFDFYSETDRYGSLPLSLSHIGTHSRHVKKLQVIMENWH